MSGLAISDYRLGDLIGRGASGSVYRGINFKTGETVAIKSISLSALSPSSLPDIMSEIDLLKNLNHPNIVKYKGFEQDANSLHIILEYCENGSLQTILKKFGKFPESLVAVYITQVLEGLIYLHEQGVIHRDIKGANILTDKKGSVKLADFGVAAGPAGASLDDDGRNDNEVVGSPYWMAPEVIEQNGSSTASDIWSVGCVVVELLEGQPPHGDLAPMQAMWRIVQDESMRVPEGASPIVKDFLYHCFQKDPNIRVSAKKLLKHPWILATRNENDDSEGTPSPPLPITTPHEPTRTPSGKTVTIAPPPAHYPSDRDPAKIPASNSGGSDTVRAKKKPSTVYDEAISRVREWNEALNASPSKINNTIQRRPDDGNARKAAVDSMRPKHSKKRSEPKQLMSLFTVPGMPSRSSADSLSAEASTSAGSSPHRPMLNNNLHVQDALSRIREEDSRGGVWDADFASDITLAQIQSQKEDAARSEDQSQHTLRPVKTPPAGFAVTPAKAGSSSRAASTSYMDDYSDMAFDEDEPGLEAKMASLKLKTKSQRGILHPNDISKMRSAAPAPITHTNKVTNPSTRPTPMSTHSSPTLQTSGRLDVESPFSPLPYGRSAPGSKANSVRSRTETSDSLPELHKYTEDAEEDYSDILDKPSNMGKSNTSAGTDSTGGKQFKGLQLTKRSYTPSFDDDEATEMDPFAEIDDSFDVEDFETKLLRDKKATQCAHIDKLVDGLVPSAPSAALQTTCDELLALFDETSEQLGLEAHFVSSHGLLAVLEMLEVKTRRDTAAGLLKIVNTIVMRDLDALESFCLVGGIQVIIPYTSKRHSPETRLEAALFIQQLIQSPLTMQMFISCRGLRILVELLDEDYSVNRTLILSSLEGVGAVFELQSPTPRNDFCRMFVREGILDPLSSSLLSILRDGDLGIAHESVTRSINVLLLFSQVSQADSRVREAFASRTVIIRLLKACEKLQEMRGELGSAQIPLQEKLLATALKAVKHLAASPPLIEVLQNSNAMEVLVSLLGKTMKEDKKVETSSHIFQTIWSMTKLSKARQEEAASAGIIPLLKKVIKGTSRLDQFALPIFCELANAGKVSRRLLWKNDGLHLYLKLLGDPYWRGQALDAILVWMQDETARVEDALLEKEATEAIMNCFVQSSGSHLEKVIDSLLKVLRLSASLVTSISQPPLLEHLCTSLSRPLKAVIKLNVLRLTKILFENHSNPSDLSRFGIRDVVEKLSRQDEAVLVRELAKEILPALPTSRTRVISDPRKDRDTHPHHSLSESQHRHLSSSQRDRDPPRLSTARPTSIPFSPSSSASRAMPPPPLPYPAESTSRARIPELFRRISPTPKLAIRQPGQPTARERERQRTDPGLTSISMALSDSSTSSSGRVGSAREPLRPSMARSESSDGGKKHKRTVSRSVKDVSWQADENGILRTVRKTSK